MKKNILTLSLLALVAFGGILFAGSGIDFQRLGWEQRLEDLVNTIMSTATTINGETIANDTVDEDALDWGTGTGQIGMNDLVSTVAVPDTNAYTVLAANAGKVHIMPNLTADCTITLPTQAASLEYKFVYKGVAADAQDWVIDAGDDDSFYLGGVIQLDHATSNMTVQVPDGNSNSKMTVLTPEPGTVVELYASGTNWVLNGVVVSDETDAVTWADQ